MWDRRNLPSLIRLSSDCKSKRCFFCFYFWSRMFKRCGEVEFLDSWCVFYLISLYRCYCFISPFIYFIWCITFTFTITIPTRFRLRYWDGFFWVSGKILWLMRKELHTYVLDILYLNTTHLIFWNKTERLDSSVCLEKVGLKGYY